VVQKGFARERNDHGEWNGQNLNASIRAKFCLRNISTARNFSLPNFNPQPDGALPRALARDEFSVF